MPAESQSEHEHTIAVELYNKQTKVRVTYMCGVLFLYTNCNTTNISDYNNSHWQLIWSLNRTKYTCAWLLQSLKSLKVSHGTIIIKVIHYSNYNEAGSLQPDHNGIKSFVSAKVIPSVEIVFITTSDVIIWEIFASLVIVAVCFLILSLNSINVISCVNSR